MKHTKKILALLLAMIMLLGMVACGGSNSTDNKTPENETTANPDNSGSTTPDNGNANTETQEDYNGKLIGLRCAYACRPMLSIRLSIASR